MFISSQTLEGLKIVVHSVVEVTTYLLREGANYVLTERFNQDPFEQCFGHQRKLERYNDNPDLRSVGYNDNTMRIQSRLATVAGTQRVSILEIRLNQYK